MPPAPTPGPRPLSAVSGPVSAETRLVQTPVPLKSPVDTPSQMEEAKSCLAGTCLAESVSHAPLRVPRDPSSIPLGGRWGQSLRKEAGGGSGHVLMEPASATASTEFSAVPSQRALSAHYIPGIALRASSLVSTSAAGSTDLDAHCIQGQWGSPGTEAGGAHGCGQKVCWGSSTALSPWALLPPPPTCPVSVSVLQSVSLAQ